MLSSDIKPAGALPVSPEEAEGKTIQQPESITGNANTKEVQNPASVQTTSTVAADIEYPSGLRLGLVITSPFVSMFLVSLVRISSYFVSVRPTE